MKLGVVTGIVLPLFLLGCSDNAAIRTTPATATSDSVSAGRLRWTLERTNTAGDLRAVWGADVIYVAGRGIDGAILRSSGDGDWSRVPVPRAADAIWVSGDGELFLPGAESYRSSDGAQSWRRDHELPGTYLCWRGAHQLIAAGGESVWLSRDDGASWTRVATAPGFAMSGVACADLTVVAVANAPGRARVLSTFDPAIGFHERDLDGVQLRGAAGVDLDHFVVVGSDGSGGYLSRTANAGASWERAATPASRALFAAWGAGEDFYVAGEHAALRSGDSGASWSSLGLAHNFLAVWGRSAADVFLVGEAGVIAHGHN